MAASVRIEAVAFSDPRIELLGQIAGYNRFEAMGRLAHLWSACTERETDILPAAFIRGALGKNGVEALIESGLGEEKNGECRVRGCEGRINWLASKRRASRLGGEANKRKSEAKEEPKGSQKGAEEKPNDSPLTLTLTLTPTPTLTPTLTPEIPIAASPPDGVKEKKPKKPRERDPLWDAIVEITGADATIESVANHIGRVRNALSKAKPPYSPSEVLTLPNLASIHLPWTSGRVLTLGEVEKNIGLVRSKASPVQQREDPKQRTMTPDEIAEFARRGAEAAQ